jgi:hypothetical protein
MSEKGLFASICSFFDGLFSANNAAESASAVSSSAVTSNKDNDGPTGVERYIKNQASKSNQLTGVETYIRSQATAQKKTGVETYLHTQTTAQKKTGVEAYIRNLD